MATKTVVLTGASSGLGLAVAKILAQKSSFQIVAGVREPARAEPLRHVVPESRLKVFSVDLASLAQVAAFADDVVRHTGSGNIAGVACIAGVQTITADRFSADGFELTFAVNHLAHHLLMRKLMPHVDRGAKIIYVGSGTHDPNEIGARKYGFRGARYTSAKELARGDADTAASVRQRGLDRYATSKLCNIVCCYEWARQIDPATAQFIAFDPGLMAGTGLARDYTLVQRLAWNYLLPVMATFMKGASTPARAGAVLAELLQGTRADGRSGVHLNCKGQDIPSSADTHRLNIGRDLFAGSDELIQSLIPRTSEVPEK
jgi:NAD(P)-dependent dehydrogenase (short-subunit alcohol dehydrogenase family)